MCTNNVTLEAWKHDQDVEWELGVQKRQDIFLIKWLQHKEHALKETFEKKQDSNYIKELNKCWTKCNNYKELGHQVEKCPNKDKMMEKRQKDKNEDNVIRTMEDIELKHHLWRVFERP